MQVLNYCFADLSIGRHAIYTKFGDVIVVYMMYRCVIDLPLPAYLLRVSDAQPQRMRKLTRNIQIERNGIEPDAVRLVTSPREDNTYFLLFPVNSPTIH